MLKFHPVARGTAGHCGHARALTSLARVLVACILAFIAFRLIAPRNGGEPEAFDAEETRQFEYSSQGSTSPPATNQVVTSESTRLPSLCVVDDSRDMVNNRRESDGFESKNGKWPILEYLLEPLGCEQYYSWSAFECQDKKCATSGPPSGSRKDPRIPSPLKMTSPVVEKLSKASQSNLDQNVFFITNGLDWRTEGKNRAYRVEMDVGEALDQWMNTDQANDLVIGAVQDGAKSRPNMVIGFVKNFTWPSRSDSPCNPSTKNVPEHYNIALSIYHNPKNLLNGNALITRRSIKLQYLIEGKERSGSHRVDDDGTVRVPRFLTQQDRVQDLNAVITFQLGEGAEERSCSGVGIMVNNSELAEGECKLSERNSVECKFPLLQLISSRNPPWPLSFVVVPYKPHWLEKLEETHSLRKTVESLQKKHVLRTRVRMIRDEQARDINLAIVPEEE